MNFVAFLSGALIFALLVDRLRIINWRTTKTSYVAKYLALALWTLGLFDDAARGEVKFYQLGAVVATLIWLLMSRHLWKHGPPDYTQAPK